MAERLGPRCSENPLLSRRRPRYVSCDRDRGMWLLLLMVCVMPFEQSPYLFISDTFLGIFRDFTVIKALGLIGFGWALLRIASRDAEEGILASLQAKLFVVFFVGVIVSGLLSGSGFL